MSDAKERGKFDDLIEALMIFNKYVKGHVGTHCEHDVFMICGIDDDLYVDEHLPKPGETVISPRDVARLDELGFHVGGDCGGWISYRWGSC